MDIQSIKTLGQLKSTDYRSRSIKEELRENLVRYMSEGHNIFEGIWGYEDTVIPDVERAILSRHNFNLLGLRGQAKTRIARTMVELLDEYMPVVEGSELNDDPLNPISYYAREVIEQKGDDTPIRWLHRSDRYTEKLATPDVSVSDLIGDVDPIKAANLKLSYADERVIHFGLVPRSHRCIFVINELPDLQPRIQVSLFNILQEGDIQIRGFKIRLPLDLQFVFTANPEDYTNRGSIVTPLKDRVGSQIITHYPYTLEVGKKITRQEASLSKQQEEIVTVPELGKDLIEQIAFVARESEYVDAKSGVSARLTITAMENLVSAAERRSILSKEKNTLIRIADFIGVVPAITGKVELVYEGEQEGPGIVAQNLIGKAVRTQFLNYFPNPDDERKKKDNNTYKKIIDWFGEGNHIELLVTDDSAEYKRKLNQVEGLSQLVDRLHKKESEAMKLLLMEFTLHGLSEYSQISKHQLVAGTQFKDLLSSMFNMEDPGDEPDEFDLN